MSAQGQDSLSLAAIDAAIGGRTGIWDVPCPVCGPGRRSPVNRCRRVLRIWRHTKGFASYHCPRCGLRGWARSACADIDPDHLRQVHADVEQRESVYATRRLALARWLWRASEQPGPSVRAYLESRSITLGAYPATIRELPPRRPDHHRAMIAAFGFPEELEPGVFTMPPATVRGVHLTLLSSDGSAKAGTSRDKFMIGPSAGWPLVLAPISDGLGLVIAEGIEDALSAHCATGLAVWAAGSASRLPALANAIADHIESVTLLVDGDDPGRTHSAMLGARVAERGKEVRYVKFGAGDRR